MQCEKALTWWEVWVGSILINITSVQPISHVFFLNQERAGRRMGVHVDTAPCELVIGHLDTSRQGLESTARFPVHSVCLPRSEKGSTTAQEDFPTKIHHRLKGKRMK